MTDSSKQIASLPRPDRNGAPALTAREAVLVAEIVERVGSLLKAESPRTRLVDAATVADALGVSRDWVYAHVQELNGVRIGAVQRGRLRFDLDQALAAWRSRPAHDPEQAASTTKTRTRTSTCRRPQQGTELLPVRGPTGR